MRLSAFVFCIFSFVSLARCETDPWAQVEANARQTQRVVKFCNRYAQGWLSHADPQSGLLPRRLKGGYFWNAKDCAADNYPFLVLTARVTGNYYLTRAVEHILQQEQALTNRVDAIPDTFDFATQQFSDPEIDWQRLIYGASEYAKDGLMPIAEWIGPSPWLDRMEELIRGIWKHAEVQTDAGVIPTENIEVNGELLQTMSRLYWMTGDERFKEWCYRLADYYLVHQNLLDRDLISLRDHGCEILSGLTETYAIASYKDPERRETYRPPLHALLDRILEKGTNEDGMMPNKFNPKTGEQQWGKTISDGWGYVYNAFLSVAEIDKEERYREAVRHALENAHKYLGANWEGGSADGYADSVEGALNLLNRIPVDSAFGWVEESMEFIFDKQRHDGILEAWYGDGNSARTAIMYALHKTQGITVTPWREDMQLGAVQTQDGTVHVSLSTEWFWSGQLRCDRPRHKDYFNMPVDYARINQFPEWFVTASDKDYTVALDEGEERDVRGDQLWGYPLVLEPGQTLRLTIREKGSEPMPKLESHEAALRTMKYVSGGREKAEQWQIDLRQELAKLLEIDDLQSRAEMIPFAPEIISSTDRGSYVFKEVEINSTETRRFRVVVTQPKEGAVSSFPAVVCIHGHGGDRFAVYDPESIYKGFASALAERGVITIAANVGQHEVYEEGRTLMGERLWDLIRCVDYLESLPEVDKNRIGCGGLSLGGEMAMWLGAMDTRIKSTVSCGFLTVMDQMERNHCMCWKFEGLRELVDYADIYCLIAPRALQCQNGKQEPPSQFTIPLARFALGEITPVYEDYGVPGRVQLHVHEGGHEVDLEALLAFLIGHLGLR